MPIKLAIIGGPKGVAVDNIFWPLTEELLDLGYAVDYYDNGEDAFTRFEEYDLIHFSHLWHLMPFNGEGTKRKWNVPITANIHHVTRGRETYTVNHIKNVGPAHLIVSDRFWQQWLGFQGFYNVTLIPQIFDQSCFKPLPLPEVFTVGWLGTNHKSKRFDIIRQACEELRMPYVDGARKDLLEVDSPLWLADQNDFYRRISCYVVASFTDAGPLPPQEALLCGRPVVSTVVGSMPDVLQPGLNGEFYNGSVEDLKRVLVKMHDRFEQYDAAKFTRLPSISTVAAQYATVFEEVLKCVQ